MERPKSEAEKIIYHRLKEYDNIMYQLEIIGTKGIKHIQDLLRNEEEDHEFLVPLSKLWFVVEAQEKAFLDVEKM